MSNLVLSLSNLKSVFILFIVPRSRTCEIARGASHCMWVLFYFLLFFPFCPFSLIFKLIKYIPLIFFWHSAIIKQILYLFFFILAKVDLFLYVNFWSCLWVHWVNWCQLTAACRARTLKVVWVNKCGWCFGIYAYGVLLVIFKGDLGH